MEGFFLFFSPYFARWAQYGLFIALLPLAIRAFFRPISPVGLNTGFLSPYCRWQYGLFIALFRPLGSIRALGGYCPLGNTPPSRGCATLTPGCVQAPLQGAFVPHIASNARCAGVFPPSPFMEREPGSEIRSPAPFFSICRQFLERMCGLWQNMTIVTTLLC